MSNPVARLLIASIVSGLACGTVAAASKTVPGERWQHKMSMQMAGMSMPLPGGEVCAPVGKAAQELSKPDKDCTLSNVRQSGNKFSADVKCTGKEPMEGTMEMTTGPDSMKGKMSVRSEDGEMTLVTESRKLGACQAVDTEALVAEAEAQGERGRQMAAQAEAQQCASSSFPLKADPAKVTAAAFMFLGANAPCAGKPLPADFCSTVQSRSGFGELSQMEKTQAGIVGRSLGACNLGTGKAAIDALNAKHLAEAEAEGDGNYLIANAPARARQLATTQCMIKGEMWAGRQAKWDTFCDSNFASEARGNR